MAHQMKDENGGGGGDPDPKPDTNMVELESMFKAALRSFEVVLADGRKEHVFAHFHDASTDAGHLSFITIALDGHHVISRMFNTSEWKDLREIFNTPPAVPIPVNLLPAQTPTRKTARTPLVIIKKPSRGVH